MKGYLLKGLAICTFFCTMIALPSWAEICFLPSGICDLQATPTDGGLSCDVILANGNYLKAPIENKICTEHYVQGCKGYKCREHLNCQAQGYILGPTQEENPPLDKRNELWECKWCLQGTNYWWQCTPVLCEEGLTHLRNCPKGQEWREVVGAKPSYHGACGKCEEICPDGNCTDEDCPEGYSASKPAAGCYKCDTLYLDDDKTKACYRCHRMNENYITASQKYEQGEGCYSYDEETTDVDPICYLPAGVTCADDEWLDQTELSSGRTKCNCRDCTYDFTADETMRYTAAGGANTNNVVSKRICGESKEYHPYNSPDKVGDCTISKSESGVLTVTCPPNLTTTEKRNTFVIKQYKKDGETLNKEITVTVIVDPDTCDNPAAVVAGCGQPGYARFDEGPRPACYKTKLENSCETGYLSFDSGAKSIAGQNCYYCVKNTCPTEGFTLGATPNPAEGYDTEKTDANNNCYKTKECASGSTAYQSVNDCGNKQHPDGWIYGFNGYSGNLKCGYCNPKTCTGGNFKHKCEAQPRCADESAKSCGYKDLTTPTSIEYEGDTPKYNCNDKSCPTNTSTSTTDGCGQNVDSEYRSADKICWRYEEPNTNCDPGFKYDYTQCQCVCDLDQTCPEGQALNKELCACQDTCVPGDGFWNSPCCEDSDCYNSSEFPLYCFNVDGQGRCVECNTIADCSFEGAPRDRYLTKYQSAKFVNDGHPLKLEESAYKYPKYDNDAREFTFLKYKGEPDFSDRTKCTNHECIASDPCAKGNGEFGAACCTDKDCFEDELPLYCFKIPALDTSAPDLILRDNKGEIVSNYSCRECGALADCETYDKDMTRLNNKYDADFKTTYANESRYQNGFTEYRKTVAGDTPGSWHRQYYVPLRSSLKQYLPSHGYACRRGECLTFGSDVDENQACANMGLKSNYHECGNKGYKYVKDTDFGTPCYECK